MFQFTLPHGERPLAVAPRAVIAVFQFTLPHGERLKRQRAIVLISGFNSRSRMGSDSAGRVRREQERVSIHAPAWGATERPRFEASDEAVSIHAPAWGATRAVPECHTCKWFQFTLPHGERPADRTASAHLLTFQFTLPHGERRAVLCACHARTRFNSRSRMGSDLVPRLRELGVDVSIHAPAWGATSASSPPPPAAQFQFTLPHGERPCLAHSRSKSPAFQFTLPHGERLWPLSTPSTSVEFQFTLPHGERQDPARGPAIMATFQFTLPHGERRPLPACRRGRTGFNSRSRMGSDRATRRGPAWGAGFNSRSRMGSDSTVDSTFFSIPVSIHAPAWGATCAPAHCQRLILVSIHAPAWGATSINAIGEPSRVFQFTLPHGERLLGGWHRAFLALVSIHAPAWGATGASSGWACIIFVSIHAPAWGATPPPASSADSQAFQFTLPHGERPLPRTLQGGLPRFNSRSRMGSDCAEHGELFGVGVSIHAPAWGATSGGEVGEEVVIVSIHAPAWGATSRRPLSSQSAGAFQFTLPHGERPPCPGSSARPRRFNSRSRMGSDELELVGAERTGVSIHAPAWGATARLGGGRRTPCVSIHAPAWGATALFGPAEAGPEFQFTLPHGERLTGFVLRLIGLLVSIHAPAWGATRPAPASPAWTCSFNSRSRMGSDDGVAGGAAEEQVSIHAPAWGATELRRLRDTETQCFNSRSRMGSDEQVYHGVTSSVCFNSRSRMGSDVLLCVRFGDMVVSIHAPAWGATLRPRPSVLRRRVSIHAPAWGATRYKRWRLRIMLFQFTLPHGERRGLLLLRF